MKKEQKIVIENGRKIKMNEREWMQVINERRGKRWTDKINAWQKWKKKLYKKEKDNKDKNELKGERKKEKRKWYKIEGKKKERNISI